MLGSWGILMQSPGTIVEQAHQLIDRISTPPKSAVDFEAIADSLLHLANSPMWQVAPYPVARVGEEALYELAVAGDRPALYLVSDGVGVTSPPHCHETWAVVVGIRGLELNHLYTKSAKSGIVVETTHVAVGSGEVLLLGPDDIHSTEVVGQAATYHLHLYGRPLSALSSFQARCFSLGSP